MVQEKWVALSNTTIGVLMATINASILIISLPPIFRGIDLNPFQHGAFAYLLWILMGYMIVTSVILVTIGRLSDMLGRVRFFNFGFAIFTLGSILLYLTPGKGDTGALELILFRVVQAVGGSFLMANSYAIITDNFPAKERGFALGINAIAGTAGMSLGILIGGVLSAINWRYVFLVSVPVGILGTVWSFLKLKETSPRIKQKIDIPGNILFAAGLIILLIGITYGIVPYKSYSSGWSDPYVIAALTVGAALLIAFPFVERRMENPMFRLELFKIRAFTAGSLSGMISGMGMMGLMFMIILLFQAIWLPIHGYSYASAPFWAGIFMLPMTLAMGIFGPISGRLSDRYGPRGIATLGLTVSAMALILMVLLPYDFNYIYMALLLFMFGSGMGMFTAPNTSAVMSSVPAETRGSASGMLNTMRNVGNTASMGIFFTILILGLTSILPHTITTALNSAGASKLAPYMASLPPTDAIFGAFLGINPVKVILSVLPTSIVSSVPSSAIATITARSWFPGIFAPAFMRSLHDVFIIAFIITIIAVLLSLFRSPLNLRTGSKSKNVNLIKYDKLKK
ncbi:MFS transporter [Picrophilus oshimae]|uniref:Drug resistance transporter, EmrB/QacA subfamily n=1 Tax=Picrophilus torridus (strain ATCC 700027 / DSM 9790 / JCM 10055 / NBRC 100828 / KAW 2/3) TaxID=1122961 RepID=A0A8G2L7Q2_PICTO|nr:MFS transporter [Picrophilus oshimae]SMD31255.1 drug resistance transporter, EmrB/QacA subfamily [Picrophilus oshimae DSM 9789]